MGPEDLLSRRGFLKLLKPKTEEVKSPASKVDSTFQYQLTRRQLFRATGVGVGLLAAEMATTPIVKGLDIPQGNAGMTNEVVNDLMVDNPQKGIVFGGIIAPAIEEAVFRAGPNMLLDSVAPDLKGHYVWKAAIPTSVFFALAHGVKEDKLPLSQFAAGLVFWKMVREGNYPSAFVAHSAHNTLIFSMVSIVARTLGIRF